MWLYKKGQMGRAPNILDLVTIVVIVSIIIIPEWDVYAKTDSNLANDLSIIKPESYVLQQKVKFIPSDSLVQYTLQKINEDRARFNLSTLELSLNKAAQVHAEELFDSRSNSTHWSMDGMKPYMKFSLYRWDRLRPAKYSNKRIQQQ